MGQMFEQKTTRDADERYLPRWEVKNRVLYQLDHSIGVNEATTKDLNCAGTCILAKNNFEPNQKLKLTIYLEDQTPITLNGTVCWIKDQDQEEKQVGIRFFNTSSEAQDMILRYAFELNDYKLANHWFKDWEGKS